MECTTAEAAELIIASTGTELQALITDHRLTGAMSGVQLARYTRRRHPKLNIVIISGSAVKPIPVNATFLQKPFTAAQLLEASAIEKRGGLAPKIASIPHAFSHTANSLRTAAPEFPTFRYRQPSEVFLRDVQVFGPVMHLIVLRSY